MGKKKTHIRYCMLYEFNRGSTATEATRNIHSAYGEKAVDDCTCRRWFFKFPSDDTTLTDKSRSGRPIEFDDEALQALLDANPLTDDGGPSSSCPRKGLQVWNYGST